MRVRVFVDFWNFTLSLRSARPGFMTDWNPIGPALARAAAGRVDPSATFSFEAMHVYGSIDPAKENDKKLLNWFANTLDRMPGTHVILVERQRKIGYPKCPKCQTEVRECSSCGGDMRGTEEKGVDTRIATDMISLAWADAYDVAMLVSADRDFVPVAEFLQTRGVKVIHGWFPPKGSLLSQKCWGNVSLTEMMGQFERKDQSA
jgi:Zn ribbon nucleic-acid-binding protein